MIFVLEFCFYFIDQLFYKSVLSWFDKKIFLHNKAWELYSDCQLSTYLLLLRLLWLETLFKFDETIFSERATLQSPSKAISSLQKF